MATKTTNEPTEDGLTESEWDAKWEASFADPRSVPMLEEMARQAHQECIDSLPKKNDEPD